MHRQVFQPRHAVPITPMGRCTRPPLSRRPALSGIPDAELPPYALLSTPVYSLSSTGAGGTTTTLNMITYASPIALRPQRKYALGLYVQSLTYQNIKETGRAVLQILQQHHASLFHLLGKTSGRDVDKVAELRRLGFRVQEEYGLPVLSDAAGIMELRAVSDFIPAGDHEVVVCDVVSWKFLDAASSGAAAAAPSAAPSAAADAQPTPAAGGAAAAGPQGSSDGSSSSQPLYTGYLRQQGFL